MGEGDFFPKKVASTFPISICHWQQNRCVLTKGVIWQLFVDDEPILPHCQHYFWLGDKGSKTIGPGSKKSKRPVDALAVKAYITHLLTTWNQEMLAHLKMNSWKIQIIRVSQSLCAWRGRRHYRHKQRLSTPLAHRPLHTRDTCASRFCHQHKIKA